MVISNLNKSLNRNINHENISDTVKILSTIKTGINHVSKQYSADETSSFVYVPVISCDIERIFSIHKSLFREIDKKLRCKIKICHDL